MRRKSLQRRGSRKRHSNWRKIAMPALVLLVLAVAVVWVSTWLTGARVEPARAPGVPSPGELQTESKAIFARAGSVESLAVKHPGGTLTPQPMQLLRTVLLDKPWNSAPDALGQKFPRDADGAIRDGSVVGPNAVAWAGDAIFVLDSGSHRLAVYDATGRMVSSISLPGTSYGDLVADPSDSSLFVVDHLNDAIYKVRGGEVREVGSVSLMDISLGLKFGYDAASDTLYVHDHELDGDIPLWIGGGPVDADDRVVQSLAPVRGDFEEENRHNILLKFKDGQEMRIAFELPVQCVEEMVMDRQGIVWVLYTLEGDFQMRRLARVDPVRGTVGVAPLDVYFLYDSVRHMAPSGNGVVVVAGDLERGRLLSFEYSGTL